MYQSRHNAEWSGFLWEALEQTVKDAYNGKWKASDNRSLACDIFDVPGVCEVKHLEFHDEAQEIWIYVILGKSITQTYQIQTAVYQMLGMASEDYLVVVPFYSHEMVQFSFILGTPSHGHIGKVIATKEDNPHIPM